MTKTITKIASFLLGICFLLTASAGAVTLLPAEKAFVFSAHLEGPQQLIAEWQIAPGFYLYRYKLRIASIPAHPTTLGSIGWPKSKIVYLHSNTGAMPVAHRVFQGKVRVSIPLTGKVHDERNIAISYQGCAEDGYCYAPIKKQLHIAYPFAKQGLQNAPLLTIGGDAASTQQHLMTDQQATSALMSHHQVMVIILCFLGLGLLLAFTPCSLPMIPILSSIIVGQKSTTTGRSFYLSLSYVLGVALTYALAGMVMAWLGSGVQGYFQNPWIITAFSWVFILLALSMLGIFELRLPSRWQQKVMGWQEQHSRGSYWSSFLIGSFSTLIISPCVTAPLVGVLAYVTETGNVALGGTALFAMGLGMGLPLLALGFSMGKFLPTAGPWMEIIKKLFAFLLLGMAIWLLSRIFPAGLTLFLWACLLMSLAVYFFFAVEALKTVWRYGSYLLGVLAGLYALVLFIGVSMSYTSPFYPFEKHQETLAQSLSFVTVKNMKQLQTLLQQAKIEKKPVMLDFYASWCESCRIMETVVLQSPQVQAVLQHFVLLRADVTENNAFDQALLKQYKVIAPPTFLFFNRQGQEVMDKRMVGEVGYQPFLEKIRTL